MGEENREKPLYQRAYAALRRRATGFVRPYRHRSRARKALHSPRVRHLIDERPQYLKIETTNICTALCAFCVYPRMKREKGVMPLELFEKTVLQYIDADGGALTLSPLVGDVLVDKRFLERMRFCRRYPEITNIGVHTNLIALPRWSDEEVKEIFELIDVFNCSIGPSPDVYRDMFGVDEFETVVTSIERVARLIKGVKKKPSVRLNGRAAAGEFEEDPRLAGLSLELMGHRIDWLTSYYDWGEPLPDLPRSTPVLRDCPEQLKILPCRHALTAAVVYRDGKVSLCGCADSEGALLIGDINKRTLAEILSGETRRKFITSFAEGDLNPFCRRCTFYTPLIEAVITEWVPGTNPFNLTGD